jgi:hypothetical protein
MNQSSKHDLIRLLQNAYSGEKAAAYAYRGHAQSVTSSAERDEITKIENDEWEHRESLRQMLSSLDAQPRFSREIAMTAVGVLIYCLCRLGGFFNFLNFGWYMSMCGAGKLERSNIGEYEVAALMARACGQNQFVEDLIHMAEVEWDHEMYFRSKALTSQWSKRIPVWSPPPSRGFTRQNIN